MIRRRLSTLARGPAKRRESARTVQLPSALGVPARSEEDEVDRISQPGNVVALHLLPLVPVMRRVGGLEDEALCFAKAHAQSQR